jgi:ribonuclease P protein component
VVLWVGSKKKPEYANSATRVGFVVSKKTHKRSVRRNRLKRLMRENYRQLLKDGKIDGAQKFISLIFVGMEKSLGKDFSQMKEIMIKLLSNLEKN